MTNRHQLDANDLNPGAIAGQQNLAENKMRPGSWQQVPPNHYEEGNKRMRASLDAMPLGTGPAANTHPQPVLGSHAQRGADAPTPNALNKQVDGGHYKDLKIQPIEYIHANNIPFAEGNIIKYVTRWRAKGGVKDLEKAKHFIELLIELESRNG